MTRLFLRLGMIVYFVLLVVIVAFAWSNTTWGAAKIVSGPPASNPIQPLVKVATPLLMGIGVVSLFKWSYGKPDAPKVTESESG